MPPTRFCAVVLAALAVIAPGLSGCSNGTTATAEQVAEAPVGQPAPGRVGVAQFAAVITEPGVQIIDVRTAEEFAGGHIQGAVNIPVQQSDFTARVAQLDPKGTYAVYCRSGNRSKGAVAQMKSAGITMIYELAEGTNGWTADGQPLTR
ncbi:MAG: rhodanese-like domain-containing protein [Mycobacterium sp.]|nr:rhodanese-like domain-containing protein [Mycobacterium sp.]